MLLNATTLQLEEILPVPGYPEETNVMGSKLVWCKMSRDGLHKNSKTLAAHGMA